MSAKNPNVDFQILWHLQGMVKLADLIQLMHAANKYEILMPFLSCGPTAENKDWLSITL